MNTTTPKVSPLRQRMIDDMRMRKLEPKTQSGYIRAVRHFTVWLGRSPRLPPPHRSQPLNLRLCAGTAAHRCSSSRPSLLPRTSADRLP
jgi:hypothetical protein